MSRYYHALRDDNRRCCRCERRCQFFGDRDPDSGWIGWCKICNSVWYSWKLNRILLSCNRRKLDYGLFQILCRSDCAANISKFLLRRPQDVLTSSALRHMFAVVQVLWISAPLDWIYEATDSEAEEERYLRQTLRTLREIPHANSASNPIILCVQFPRLLDIVCGFLYIDRARSHVERLYGSIPLADNYEITIYNTKDHSDTISSTSDSKRQLDWQLFIYGGRTWLWRFSTEECFYVDSPPESWTRYLCPVDNVYWWHNDLSEAWFFES